MAEEAEIVKVFDIQDYLNTEKDVIEYLKVSLEEDTPEEFIRSMSNILKSRGYAKIAKKIGVSREGLYKSFSGETDPRFGTIFKAVDSLGFRFSLVAK